MGIEAKHLHGQSHGASIYSECERNDLLLETLSYTKDMMLWTIVDVISELQLVWYHQYSGCDDTDTVDKMSNIEAVMT